MAKMACDFYLPELKGLSKLLLVHGRASYLRISQLILFTFYKTIAFTAP